MTQYWPAAAFGAAIIYCVWVVWQALERRVVRVSGRDWSRDSAPAVYWAFTAFHAGMVALLVVGLIIRGPSALIAG